MALDTNSLANMVRSWVHFDNLAASLTRQAQQARSARYKWEEQIIDFLKNNKMTNAIIQITGGRLTLTEEKHSNPLTLQRLEALLHEYYNQKPNGSDDETVDILTYIKAHKGYTLETKLKKT